jgi:hypothetical protein
MPTVVVGGRHAAEREANTMPVRTALLVAVALAAASCAEPAAPAAGPTPVVTAHLIVGDTVQDITVTFAARADSSLTMKGLPVPAGDVSLVLADDDGGAWPLVSASPGHFRATVTVMQGHVYRLSGAVAGRQVTAVTRVPAGFTVQSPAPDTLRSTDAVACRFSYAANEYCFLVQATADEPINVWCSVTQRPGGLMETCYGSPLILRLYGGGEIRTMQIFGTTADATRPRLSGVLVFFGSTLVAERVVDLP